MPGKMKQGQSIFIPFKDGESIYDSQNKARMYMSEEKFRASFPGWRFGEVDLVEYVPKPRWIPVEERLPGCGERVLATDDVFVGEAYRTSAKSWYRMTGFPWREAYGTVVKRWMPLPETPKEEV